MSEERVPYGDESPGNHEREYAVIGPRWVPTPLDRRPFRKTAWRFVGPSGYTMCGEIVSTKCGTPTGKNAVTRRHWLMAAALVSVVSLACTATPEDADAWVLWEKRMTFKDGGETTVWEPLDGFDRLADCQKSGQEILQTALDFMGSGGRTLLSVRPDGRSAAYEVSEGGARQTVDTRYLCFPGSLDPRSPKT